MGGLERRLRFPRARQFYLRLVVIIESIPFIIMAFFFEKANILRRRV